MKVRENLSARSSSINVQVKKKLFPLAVKTTEYRGVAQTGKMTKKIEICT